MPFFLFLKKINLFFLATEVEGATADSCALHKAIYLMLRRMFWTLGSETRQPRTPRD